MNFAETIDTLNFSYVSPEMVKYSFGRSYCFNGSETLGSAHVEPTDVPVRRFRGLREQFQKSMKGFEERVNREYGGLRADFIHVSNVIEFMASDLGFDWVERSTQSGALFKRSMSNLCNLGKGTPRVICDSGMLDFDRSVTEGGIFHRDL